MKARHQYITEIVLIISENELHLLVSILNSGAESNHFFSDSEDKESCKSMCKTLEAAWKELTHGLPPTAPEELERA